MEYAIRFTAGLHEEGFDFLLEVTVPVKSLCPCSKGISDRGAHNQRSTVKVALRSDTFIWIEDVVAAIEAQASAPLYALLKREDEKFITELAYDNPKFAEDLARDSLVALREIGGMNEVRVVVENHESIHNHQAYAEVTWSALESASPRPRFQGTSLPTVGPEGSFGSWLRQIRLDRKMSQSQLAEELSLTASYVSRVESGDRAPSCEMLDQLARIFGFSEAEMHLRAGRLPPEFQAVAMVDPQAILSRLER